MNTSCRAISLRRIEDHLASKGRRLIGWDEILEGGLPPKATVMSWRGMGGATAAAESGHDYVATPTSHCYLDYPAKQISLEKAYSFEPIPEKLAAAASARTASACRGTCGPSTRPPRPTSTARSGRGCVPWPRSAGRPRNFAMPPIFSPAWNRTLRG